MKKWVLGLFDSKKNPDDPGCAYQAFSDQDKQKSKIGTLGPGLGKSRPVSYGTAGQVPTSGLPPASTGPRK